MEYTALVVTVAAVEFYNGIKNILTLSTLQIIHSAFTIIFALCECFFLNKYLQSQVHMLRITCKSNGLGLDNIYNTEQQQKILHAYNS